MAARGKNVAVAVGLVGFVGACASVPYFLTLRMKNITNLQQQEDSLSGSQVMRGAYVNTGSRDAGVDPDWNFASRSWEGKRVSAPNDAAPSDQ
mmetsp:Transcript_8350/g.14789  ORF Transcript_8350/g.14789 Transcript_8350/m.14789 type:complete len:93 (-) Transcript_8350:224-502(-)